MRGETGKRGVWHVVLVWKITQITCITNGALLLHVLPQSPEGVNASVLSAGFLTYRSSSPQPFPEIFPVVLLGFVPDHSGGSVMDLHHLPILCWYVQQPIERCGYVVFTERDLYK